MSSGGEDHCDITAEKNSCSAQWVMESPAHLVDEIFMHVYAPTFHDHPWRGNDQVRNVPLDDAWSALQHLANVPLSVQSLRYRQERINLTRGLPEELECLVARWYRLRGHYKASPRIWSLHANVNAAGDLRLMCHSSLPWCRQNPFVQLLCAYRVTGCAHVYPSRGSITPIEVSHAFTDNKTLSAESSYKPTLSCLQVMLGKHDSHPRLRRKYLRRANDGHITTFDKVTKAAHQADMHHRTFQALLSQQDWPSFNGAAWHREIEKEREWFPVDFCCFVS